MIARADLPLRRKISEGVKMGMLDEYHEKMGKGTVLIELFFWLYCPLQVVTRIWTIVKMAMGREMFEAETFIISFIVTAMALFVVATAIFLNKLTFILSISFMSLLIIYTITKMVRVFYDVLKLNTGIFAAITSIATGIAIAWSIIILLFAAVFLAYFIEKRSIFGFKKS